MTFRTATIAAVSAIALLAGCAQQEEEVVMVDTPIYSKDGRIIGMRPTVANMGTGAVGADAEFTGGLDTDADPEGREDAIGGTSDTFSGDVDGDDSDG